MDLATWMVDFPKFSHIKAHKYTLVIILFVLDWRTLEEQFKSLCSVLPHNYRERLKSIPELLKDGEQLSKLISSSPAKINEKIITYLIVKLCHNDSDTSLVRCSVMDDLTCTQQIRYGTYVQ